MLRTAEVGSNAAHIYGNHLLRISRYKASAVTYLLIHRKEQCDLAIDVYPHYGSDVEATLHSGYDIRHGLIGAGVYASHNYERSHMDGVENTYKLLKKYITK